MPKHDLEALHYLINEESWVLATTRCRRKVESLGLTRAQVKQMLLALTDADFRKHFGPADTDFGEIQADAYLLWYDEETNARCQPHRGLCFYIKLGLFIATQGDSCLIASFHLDGCP